MDPGMSPDGSPDRNVTIRLSRETLVLAAALGFLGVAILLAVLFPPGSSGTSAVRPTPLRNGTTSIASNLTTVPVRTTPATGQSADATALSGQTTPRSTATSLPEPGSTVDPLVVQTATALVVQGLATPNPGQFVTTSVPTFAVTRPTTSNGANPAYPGPGQASVPTGRPTEDPLFAQQTPPPTAAQPVGQPTATQAQLVPTLPLPPPPQSTPDVQPTIAQPTIAQPRPTEGAGGAPPADASPAPTRTPRPTPKPTEIPIIVLKGDVRWTAAQSPIILRRDVQLGAGSTLTIEPGVEVRMAPGVAFNADGSVYALGQPGRPVRFVNLEGQRWDGIYGRPGSNLDFTNVEIRGGGNGGTLLVSEGGKLALKGAQITDNGGHIQVNGSRLEVRDSEISGNDMPYGAALDATYGPGGGGVTLVNNRIGGNRMANGAPPVQIASSSSGDVVSLQIESNLLVGQSGPDLVLSTSGPIQGNLTCNALVNGTNGLSIRSETLQVPGFNLAVRDNAIEDHTPPIIPIYEKLGIGRGATSEVALDMTNNWWKSSLGPYQPELHADGRGEAVGNNIDFEPWLTSRPSCAPTP